MARSDRDQTSAAADGAEPEPVRVVVVDKWGRTFGILSFLIIATAALYFARDFLLPVSVAYLLEIGRASCM